MLTPLSNYVVYHPYATVLSIITLYVLSIRIYNIYFHPLAKYPGPWTRAAFHFPYHWQQLLGRSLPATNVLHRKYGPVVRVGPDRLSFIRSPAWKDIYGFQSDRGQIPKDYKRFPGGEMAFLPLFGSNNEDHTRLRKLVAHAFSETALREQEPLIQSHITELINYCESVAQTSANQIDLSEWFNRLTFDIISDLTFGESFDNIKKRETDDIIRQSLLGANFLPFVCLTFDYAVVDWLFNAVLMLPNVRRTMFAGQNATTEKVERRINLGAEARKDFMTYILRHNDEKGASIKEIRALTSVFMSAGGEEPASQMSAVMFYMLREPRILKSAQEEVRSLFPTLDDLNFASMEKMTYLNAANQETFRIRPTIPGHFPRRTVRQEVIDGFVVPAGIAVEIPTYAAARSPANFADPDAFLPERWMPEAPKKYESDDKAALQPFALGPRGCLGKNLAYLIIRSTLARLIWKFDIELCEESTNWDDQTARLVWNRPSLMVRISNRGDKRME